MAPRPSLPANRSSIQSFAAARAIFRSGVILRRCRNLKIQSVAWKNLSQLIRPGPGFNPGHRGYGQVIGSVRNNSRIPSCGSIGRTGWNADMIDSGTRIVLDQALIEYRLIGNQLGSSKNSGGTVGQAS